MNARRKIVHAVIYARTSSEDAKDEKLSCEVQDADCRMLAVREGYNVVGSFMDKDFSGRTYPVGHQQAPLDRAYLKYCREHIPRIPKRLRQGLADALAALPEGGVLLVRDRTRFARPVLNSQLGTTLAQDLQEKGVILHSFEEGKIDPESHDQALIGGVSEVVKDKEVKMRVKQSLASLDRLADDGMLTSSPTCFGFRSAGRQKVAAVENELEIVRRIYAEYIHGASIQQIARKLNADRISPGKGGSWTHKHVWVILRRPAYAGKRRDRAGVLIDSKPHAGIAPISMDDWNAVQVRLGERSTYEVRDRSGIHPFSGMLVCGHCGRRLYRYVARTPFGTSIYYGCKSPFDHIKGWGESCRLSTVPESASKRKFGGGLMECLAPLASAALLAMRLDKSGVNSTDKVEMLRRQVADMERRELSVYEDSQSGVLDPRQMATLMARYRAGRQEAEAEMRRLEADAAAEGAEVDPRWLAKMVLERKAPPADLRSALRKTISRVVVHGEHVDVEMANGQSFRLDRIHERNARLLPVAGMTLPRKPSKDSNISVTFVAKSAVDLDDPNETVLANIGESLVVSIVHA